MEHNEIALERISETTIIMWVTIPPPNFDEVSELIENPEIDLHKKLLRIEIKLVQPIVLDTMKRIFTNKLYGFKAKLKTTSSSNRFI